MNQSISTYAVTTKTKKMRRSLFGSYINFALLAVMTKQHKICENTAFHWPVFFRIRTDSYSFFLWDNTGQWKSIFSYILCSTRCWYCFTLYFSNKKAYSYIRRGFSTPSVVIKLSNVISIIESLVAVRKLQCTTNWPSRVWNTHHRKFHFTFIYSTPDSLVLLCDCAMKSKHLVLSGIVVTKHYRVF